MMVRNCFWRSQLNNKLNKYNIPYDEYITTINIQTYLNEFCNVPTHNLMKEPLIVNFKRMDKGHFAITSKIGMLLEVV